MTGKTKVYDLIFSIGEACSCSSAIRAAKLQISSYPFDWLYGSDFLGRCGILANKFNKFIEKNDLEYSHEEKSIKCNAYYNKFNGITFNHDFLKKLPFDDSYDLVREKYDRRISRLLSNIDKAHKVLVVYIETPTTNHVDIKNETLLEGYEILKNCYGKKINLLYIKNDKTVEECELLNSNVIKLVCNYKNYNSELDYVTDEYKLKNILSHYKLNVPITYKIKRFIIKQLIRFIPIHKKRIELRKKYHV